MSREDEGETRRCRARSRAAAMTRSSRHVYATGVLYSIKRCSLISGASDAGSRARKGGRKCRHGLDHRAAVLQQTSKASEL